MYFRAESLLSVAEFVRVNRNVDDDPEDNAADLARDMEQLSLATPETGERIASKVRFDLDLPSAAEDDMPLGPGIPLPEWDYRKNELLEDHVRVQEMASRLWFPESARASVWCKGHPSLACTMYARSATASGKILSRTMRRMVKIRSDACRGRGSGRSPA